MNKRTIEVTKPCCGVMRLVSLSGNVIHLPEDEIDAIMEDIKNLR